MKDLTLDELNEAPDLVKFLYVKASGGYPVGASMLNEAIEKYPEYFPDEVEHRQAWKRVPEGIKKSYYDSLQAYREKIGFFEGKGIFHYMNHGETEEEAKERDRKFKLAEEKEKELCKKFLAPYGVKCD